MQAAHFQRLDAAGFESPQVHAIAQAVDGEVAAMLNQAATREDLTSLESRLRVEIGEARAETAELRADMNRRFDLVGKEFELVRREIDQKVSAFRGEVNVRFEEVNVRFEEVNVRFAEVNGLIEKKFADFTRLMFATIGAVVTFQITIFGAVLYYVMRHVGLL